MPQPPQSPSPSSPAPAPDAEGYLFTELPVGTPLEELERVHEKKLRSFETSDDPERAEVYRKAYAIGVEKLRERLGKEAGEC